MSLGGKGLRDWIFQRATAVWLVLYIGFLVYFFTRYSPVSHAQWVGLFKSPAMKAATLITVLAMVMHAWIGLWTIITDYVHKTGLRLFIQGAVLVSLFSYLFWTLFILWGLKA